MTTDQWDAYMQCLALIVQAKADSLQAELAPHPGLLESAERNLHPHGGVGVHGQRPALHCAGDAQRTTCGQVLTPESLGVTHPVLPCGAKVILRSGDKQVLTEVIDNKLAVPGRQLEVTQSLAKMLGIEGTVELEWRFATGG